MDGWNYKLRRQARGGDEIEKPPEVLPRPAPKEKPEAVKPTQLTLF
jgi:hypothetical protein